MGTTSALSHLEGKIAMHDLDALHLNYGGDSSVAENGNHRPRTPHVRHTADGIEADLPARPKYDLELLTVREAADDTLLADGGTETVTYDVYRCGGCARVFGDEDKLTMVVRDGELHEFDEPRCPHCGTKVSYDRTAKTTATFELEAGEVPRE